MKNKIKVDGWETMPHSLRLMCCKIMDGNQEVIIAAVKDLKEGRMYFDYASLSKDKLLPSQKMEEIACLSPEEQKDIFNTTNVWRVLVPHVLNGSEASIRELKGIFKAAMKFEGALSLQSLLAGNDISQAIKVRTACVDALDYILRNMMTKYKNHKGYIRPGLADNEEIIKHFLDAFEVIFNKLDNSTLDKSESQKNKWIEINDSFKSRVVLKVWESNPSSMRALTFMQSYIDAAVADGKLLAKTLIDVIYNSIENEYKKNIDIVLLFVKQMDEKQKYRFWQEINKNSNKLIKITLLDVIERSRSGRVSKVGCILDLCIRAESEYVFKNRKGDTTFKDEWMELLNRYIKLSAALSDSKSSSDANTRKSLELCDSLKGFLVGSFPLLAGVDTGELLTKTNGPSLQSAAESFLLQCKSMDSVKVNKNVVRVAL